MNAPRSIRILFFSDTHLGFDQPLKPRIQRRRRGDDFRNNLHRIINSAIEEKIDLAIHGGDIFYRSRIPPELTSSVFDDLSKLPENDIPLYVVPGNHERSKIPHPLLAIREGVHIFSTAKSFLYKKHDISIALSGFPFVRNVEEEFSDRVHQSGLMSTEADFRMLCIHQAVVGATVGVQNYTFRRGRDVVSHQALDLPIDAVLSGHIHRAQILKIRAHNSKPIPVIYPGSIERTAFAERLETKGYYILTLTMTADGRKLIDPVFRDLPTRPMEILEIDASGINRREILALIKNDIYSLPVNSIVTIKTSGRPTDAIPSAEEIRAISPPTMNVSIRPAR